MSTILYACPKTQPTSQKCVGSGKKLASLKDFSKVTTEYDLYYGPSTELLWKIPENAWAFDMHGFYDVDLIKNAVNNSGVSFFILSYVPNNGKKAIEAFKLAVENNATIILVYTKEDKANFLRFAKNSGRNPIGLCDDQYDNIKFVIDVGFRGIHCTIGTDPEFVECDTQKSKNSPEIELAQSIEELLLALNK
jgi:hypothetical protein